MKSSFKTLLIVLGTCAVLCDAGKNPFKKLSEFLRECIVCLSNDFRNVQEDDI